MILDLLKNDGLEPKRKTANEYSSPCPECGGDDCFQSWPETNRWWCRKCERSGDPIQYLKDFHNLSFKDAAESVGEVLLERRRKPTVKKKKVVVPPEWSVKADKLVEFANTELLSNPDRLDWLKNDRGLTVETVKHFKLGWLETNYYRKRVSWGIEGNKKLFIPSGLVLPLIKEKTLRIRIRRDQQGDFGKYYVLPGSSSEPFVIRVDSQPAIIVESELDAILLWQELRNNFTIIAMGSAQIKPDEKLTGLLKAAPFIFICLDSDKTGAKQAHNYWLKTFDNAVRVAIPKKYGKDITEAHLNGLKLNQLVGVGYEFVIEMGG